VNPAKCPDAKLKESNDLINWLISSEGQSFVGSYGVAEFGQPLFTPLNSTQCGQPQFNCTCSGQVS
jgi:tungstate transport system substrate-binding protein